MAFEVFNWSPRPNPVGAFGDRTLRVQFGDGYEQEAADGIHTVTQSWPLQFVGNEVYVRPILISCAGMPAAKVLPVDAAAGRGGPLQGALAVGAAHGRGHVHHRGHVRRVRGP